MPIICDRLKVNVLSPIASPSTFLRLGNGVTLVHQEMPSVAVVSVDIWVKAGAIKDSDQAVGMAHFLEHMIFKGTEAIAAGEFDLLIESDGGISNAATSHDYVHYSFTVNASRLAVTLPYLCQMLLHAKIDDEALEQERLVVLEELSQGVDDPDWKAHQHLMQIVYGDHPYSRSVIGTEEMINAITAEQMREYHRSHYRPEQMTVAIAGAVNREDAIKIVDAAFASANSYGSIGGKIGHGLASDANSQNITVAEKLNLAQPSQRNYRHTIVSSQVQHSRLNLAWIGAGIQQIEEAIWLELVANILTEGRSSRLIRELREELGWVLDIDSSFALRREAGVFTISACLEGDRLELVESKIIRQIQDLIDQPISMNELNKAKRSLCNQFTFSLEAPSQVASFLGYYSLMGCENLCSNWSTAYCEIIRQAQPMDLQALVKKYLAPDAYVVTNVIPAIS